MVCPIIDHTKETKICSKLKWNHQPQRVLSLQSFEHFDVIFWPVRVQTIENCCQFVLYNNNREL